MVLIVLLKLIIVGGFVFSILNLLRDQYLLAIIEITSSMFSLGIYLKVRNVETQKQIDRLALVYAIMFFSIMMFVFSYKGISNTAYVWGVTIPMISYLLLGSQKGFIMTTVFFLVTIAILLNKYLLQEIHFEKVDLANILFSLLVFWGFSHSYERANSLTKIKLNKMAIYDKLTGLYNRTMLNRLFAQTIKKAQNENKKICFISFDLDFFKGINDQYGHVFGDKVLKKFSKMLKNNTPDSAFTFRLGGEEFAIIMATESLSQSKDFSEYLRQQTQTISINHNNKPVSITVSIGIAINDPETATLNDMLKLSDKLLYQAKNQGRNTIIY